MILRTRKRYDRALKYEYEAGIAIGQRDARQRALNARDHGYDDGFAAGTNRAVLAVAGTLEIVLSKVERQAAEVSILEAEATTRWEKRRLRGQIEALEQLAATLTDDLEEARAS